MKLPLRNNTKTEFTRMCISEAIIELLQKCELPQIRISNVVTRAGVSRMTFYNYYDSIESALKDYVHIIVEKYILQCNNHPEIGGFREYAHILFSLKFFDEYNKYFLVMKRNGLYNILIDAVNEFMLAQRELLPQISIYEMNYYAGGLLNTFLCWQENRSDKSAEDVASFIYEHYAH